MGLLITTEDFVAKFKISEDSFTELDPYIQRYESKYLKDLLGVELFDLFKADVVAHLPILAIYLNIFNEIRPTLINEWQPISEGMKDMLLGFVYFEYMRDIPFTASVSGAVQSVFENSNPVAGNNYGLYERYNNSIRTYWAIQHYIVSNPTDYDTYLSTSKGLSNPMI